MQASYLSNATFQLQLDKRGSQRGAEPLSNDNKMTIDNKLKSKALLAGETQGGQSMNLAWSYDQPLYNTRTTQQEFIHYRPGGDNQFVTHQDTNPGDNLSQGRTGAVVERGDWNVEGQWGPGREDNRGPKMDYNWLGPDHDPIAIDANLAEIDFDDYKNEDLQNAFAFSLQSFDEASSSGTDMSICKSEALFSSMKEMPESIIQDSLTVEDFNYSDQIKVNKNNYTLTFSGHGSITSHQPAHASVLDQHSHPTHHHVQEHQDGIVIDEDASSKFTTWSNVVRHREPHGRRERGRPRCRDENNINNNMDSSRKSRSLPNIAKDKPAQIKSAWRGNEEEEKFTQELLNDEPRLLNMYMRQKADRNSWNGSSRSEEYETDSNEYTEGFEDFARKDNDLGQIPTMKSKDAVNHFLKNTSRLTSIEENTEATGLSGTSSEEPTMRPVPTPRQRSLSTRSSMSTTPSLASSKSRPNTSQSSKINFPDLDFLENDVGLWDAFFTNTKNSSKFHSVLQPSESALPVDEYLKGHSKRSGGSKTEVKDLTSLRVLLPTSQKHLAPDHGWPESDRGAGQVSPIRQVCNSLSRLNHSSGRYLSQRDQHNQAIRSMVTTRTSSPHKPTSPAAYSAEARDILPPVPPRAPIKVVRVKEAWAPVVEQVEGYVPDWEKFQEQADQATKLLRLRRTSGENNLNLINNNETREKALKRRSYQPQEFLTKVLSGKEESNLGRRSPRRSKDFPKSGSQGNLCDSWQDPVSPASSATPTTTPTGHVTRKASTPRTFSAEYPFQNNLCLGQQQAINFDLTHKRGLFVSLYAAVERLLLYQDQSSPSYSAKAACRCILLHEFCPALHAIMEDGLKEEVITSFGRMKTSVWRMLEAVMQQGPAQRNTCDLVMMLNTKFSSEEDFKKFSGFVIGLLNMSCLHIWFSKLKWSMDVLLRFYERHAFICALHKETRLLFDELNFCLQRLYSIPFHVDLPFNDDILEEITTTEYYKKREHCNNCACSRTPTTGSENSSVRTSGLEAGRDSQGSSRPVSTESSRSGRSNKSRIPRPISLPKRLEEKLSVRAARQSPQRSSSESGPEKRNSANKKSPVKPNIPARPKLRVKDTIRLFDAKSSRAGRGARGTGTSAGGLGCTTPEGGGPGGRRPVKAVRSPKTGAGEAMAGFDSSGDQLK